MWANIEGGEGTWMVRLQKQERGVISPGYLKDCFFISVGYRNARALGVIIKAGRINNHHHSFRGYILL